MRMTKRPIGLIASDNDALAIARRFAGVGEHVMFYMIGNAQRKNLAPNLEAASTAADVVLACEIVMLAIDDTRQMRELMLGTPDRPGLLRDMQPGAIIIDLGIRTPRETQALLGVSGTRGIAVVDVALVGGTAAIEHGAATVLVGGFPDAVDSVEPLLAELGRVERTGPLGSAQTAAALMGYVEAAHFAARADALTVGRALGLRGSALSHIFDGAPDDTNIVRFQRRAELVRRMAEERGLNTNVIDFDRLRPGPS
jgi:3-hydroxyisobutyrate dehydrogenase